MNTYTLDEDVLRLRGLGYTVREIAAETGVSRSSIGRRIQQPSNVAAIAHAWATHVAAVNGLYRAGFSHREIAETLGIPERTVNKIIPPTIRAERRRQREIRLRHVEALRKEGLTGNEIAARLGMTWHQVKHHVEELIKRGRVDILHRGPPKKSAVHA